MKNAGIIDPEDARWPEAERRDALLRRLLKASGWQLTREVVEAAREELGNPALDIVSFDYPLSPHEAHDKPPAASDWHSEGGQTH